MVCDFLSDTSKCWHLDLSQLTLAESCLCGFVSRRAYELHFHCCEVPLLCLSGDRSVAPGGEKGETGGACHGVNSAVACSQDLATCTRKLRCGGWITVGAEEGVHQAGTAG